MFRALKRERLVFHDPARTVALTVARRLPIPLPSDRLRGLLDKVSYVRDKLIIALSAVHPSTWCRCAAYGWKTSTKPAVSCESGAPAASTTSSTSRNSP
ncbi:hypothetical protein GCM10010313_82920 [Streptomyces violarus]|nr:hypothetical protein GCM10010313_82920 [Streptomyces violarus]